jgi:hypothetical protein
MSTCHITKPQDVENVFLFFAENTTTSRIAKLNPKEEQVLKNVSNKMKQIFNINGYRFNTIQFIELIKRILATLKTEDSLLIKGSKKTSKRSSKKTSKRSSKKTSKRVSKKNGGTKKLKYSDETEKFYNNEETVTLYKNNEKNTMYELGYDFIAVTCFVMSILLIWFAFTILNNLICSANEYGGLSETAVSALRDTRKELDESDPNDKNFFIFMFNLLKGFSTNFILKQKDKTISFLKKYIVDTVLPDFTAQAQEVCAVNLGELTGNPSLDHFFNYGANAAHSILNTESLTECTQKTATDLLKKVLDDRLFEFNFMTRKIGGDVVKIMSFIKRAAVLGGSSITYFSYRISIKLYRKAFSQKKMEIVDNPQEFLPIDNVEYLTKSSKKKMEIVDNPKSSKKKMEIVDNPKSSKKKMEIVDNPRSSARISNLKKPRVSKRKTSNIDE